MPIAICLCQIVRLFHTGKAIDINSIIINRIQGDDKICAGFQRGSRYNITTKNQSIDKRTSRKNIINTFENISFMQVFNSLSEIYRVGCLLLKRLFNFDNQSLPINLKIRFRSKRRRDKNIIRRVIQSYVFVKSNRNRLTIEACRIVQRRSLNNHGRNIILRSTVRSHHISATT